MQQRLPPTTLSQPHPDVSAQLRDLERQGSGMATFAHWCAGLLLVAFSLGSLISISHAAFVTFLAEWHVGQLDVPDGISLIVNVLLVVAADVGLLYAASVLRVLNAAGAPKEEKRSHLWAMWGASILEASTYLYLAWTFDRPTTLFLWLIVIARAVAAPLFATYLSMARPLPVGPRDVAYQASLASGKGVIHDITRLAADPDAPLERKVQIYNASALMSPQDRARFHDIVEAVRVPAATTPVMPAAVNSVPALPTTVTIVDAHKEPPTRPPTGPGSPAAAVPAKTKSTSNQSQATQKASNIIPLEPPDTSGETHKRTRAHAKQGQTQQTHKTHKTRKSVQEKRQETMQGRGVRTGEVGNASYELVAEDAWKKGANSIDKMIIATGMSRSAASSWIRKFKGSSNVSFGDASESISSDQIAQ